MNEQNQQRIPRLFEHFHGVEDPRIERNKRHLLFDIVVLTLCAVIAGAETWEEIQDYGVAKRGWLSRFLSLPNGIPSHDTIRRLFIRLNPAALEAAFQSWLQGVRANPATGEIISIDGKTARGSAERIEGASPLHMVSAWASETRMVLGQVATEEKSNEITAIPALLELIGAQPGAVVTIDAIGTQREIAEKIRETTKADYVLALKGNQPTLHDEVRELFADSPATLAGVKSHRTVEKDHGRLEVRELLATDSIEWLRKGHPEWKDLRSVAMVRSRRTIGEVTSEQTRYFISSLPSDAEVLATAIRTHWQVENTLHWTLDVVFGEDKSHIRKGYSAENFALFRRLALGLMKRDTGSKRSLKGKRKICAYSDEYLERLLFASDAAFPRPASS